MLPGEGDGDAVCPEARGGEVGLEGMGKRGDLNQTIWVVCRSCVGGRRALHATSSLARNPNRDWTIRV